MGVNAPNIGITFGISKFVTIVIGIIKVNPLYKTEG
jgi:hypothetical protein